MECVSLDPYLALFTLPKSMHYYFMSSDVFTDFTTTPGLDSAVVRYANGCPKHMIIVISLNTIESVVLKTCVVM